MQANIACFVFIENTFPAAWHMTRNARWQSRRPRYRAVAYVPNLAILVPAPELSLSDAKNNPFRKMRDTLYRERQLWSGNESVEIRYVGGSSVAGTSASSPGVPRHIYLPGAVTRPLRWSSSARRTPQSPSSRTRPHQSPKGGRKLLNFV